MYFVWRDILIIIGTILGILILTCLALENGLVVSGYWRQLVLGLIVGWQIVFHFIFRNKSQRPIRRG